MIMTIITRKWWVLIMGMAIGIYPYPYSISIKNWVQLYGVGSKNILKIGKFLWRNPNNLIGNIKNGIILKPKCIFYKPNKLGQVMKKNLEIQKEILRKTMKTLITQSVHSALFTVYRDDGLKNELRTKISVYLLVRLWTINILFFKWP